MQQGLSGGNIQKYCEDISYLPLSITSLSSVALSSVAFHLYMLE